MASHGILDVKDVITRDAAPRFPFVPVRTRLMQTLEEGFATGQKALSLIAPTGTGKTVLMAGLCRFLQENGADCVWVTLDERDATLDAMLRALRDSLAGPVRAYHPTQALLLGDEPLEGRIEAIVALLACRTDPLVIFLDHLDGCADETLGACLDALVFRTPASIRFVWASTAEIVMNASRGQLEGLIRRIGFAELSLDEAETSALLGPALQTRLGKEHIGTVQRRTEGWAAAIRLVRIILSDAPDPLAALAAFSGADADIAALLNRQLLDGFTPAMRHFLLCLAPLRQFSLALCRGVMGDAQAEINLNMLIARNLFIIPLDRNRRFYRLHNMFRDYLKAEAERIFSPEYRRELLCRAAAWCEAEGEWREAIDYALEAGNFARAKRVLEQTAQLFVRDRGDILPFIGWIDRLSAAGARPGWECHFWYIWALVFHRRYATALQQHERLAERLQRYGGEDPPPDDFAPRLGHLRLCIDSLSDRLVEAHEGAVRWLADPAPKDPFDVGWVYCLKSICLLTDFRFAEARQALRLAEPVMQEIGSPYAIGWLSLIQGTTALYEGDYAYAHETILAGLTRARAALGEDAELCDTMALIAAKSALEVGEESQARALLARGLRTAHSHGTVGSTACGFETALRLWSGAGDEPASLQDLREVASSYPPRLALMLSCYLVQRCVALGRLEDALAEAGRIGLCLEGGEMLSGRPEELAIPRCRDLLAATVIELLIATRQFSQAGLVIEREYVLAKRDGRIARLVELGLSRMAVALHLGDASLAARELLAAVKLGARRRIVRPFKEHHVVIAALVSAVKPATWFFPLAEERAFFAAVLPGPEPCVEIASKLAVEMPTKRELELLKLIDNGLSNQQIADYAGVSIGTIKWHLKNLYRKFGVSNRSAALARARTFSLLSR